MQKQTFYRRPLPAETCTAFSSEEGKRIFRKALQDGHMEGFFHLIEQFHTQSEPAYCGLGTLAMTLNALGMDPNRLWKGPWRWYSEELLDCCVPLVEVAKTGIAIEEFQCLARCNGASCHVFRPDATNTVHHFRETVKRATSSNNAHLIVSYDRSVLLQTGTGHFSPIGGYYPEEDLVLILDVARFKYPPHWVPLELLYKAMQTVDVSTNKTRGYLLVSKSSTLFHTSLFCRVNVNQSNWKEFIDDYVEKMKTILKQENVKELIKEYVSIMEPVIIDIIRPIDAHFKEKELSCDDTAQSKEHLRLLEQFYDQVKQTSVYQMIAEERGENEQTLTQNVLLTVLLYSSTPVVPVSHCCRDNSCSVSTSATILKIPDELQVLNAEVEMIREQIKAIDLSCCKRIKN